MTDNLTVFRRKYIVKAILEHCVYQLTLVDEKKTIELVFEFHSIEKPSVGDVLELPDIMLYYYENGVKTQNQMLCFGVPDKNLSVPEDFNIQEDYAFIIYTKTNNRVLMQRYYG